MPLSAKTRYAILGLVLCIGLGGFVFNQVAIEVEIPGMDMNVKDARLFANDYTSRFKLENGTKGVSTQFTLSSKVLNQTHTNVSIDLGGNTSSFLVHPNGTLYQGGQLRGNYSIWWIYIPNVLMGFGVKGGEEYDVVDPTGFIGLPGQAYLLVVDRKQTYWPSDPELMALSGAQASIECSVWDKATDELVSRALIDITCGMIEIWEGAQPSYIRVTLVDTDFPISRNRQIVLGVAVVLSIVVFVIALYLVRVPKKAKSLEPKQREQILALVGAGAGAILIEITDIWFYLFPGEAGMFLIHIAYTAAAGVMCARYKLGYKWLIPSALEIAFAFSLSTFTGDAFVPSMTAFMGSTITWLCMIWASGIVKHVNDESRGIKKILADIV
ncbi:MAG: hypothetical protein JW839_04755 [Candidatus Lokiarchaeota archaeon]|nr:hypothetical protein [Candidatus Lokiarchaeota archaeon]